MKKLFLVPIIVLLAVSPGSRQLCSTGTGAGTRTRTSAGGSDGHAAYRHGRFFL
ncbi:MAG: hypothetical protein ABID71_08445 [Chloroflexota bacterium]